MKRPFEIYRLSSIAQSFRKQHTLYFHILHNMYFECVTRHYTTKNFKQKRTYYDILGLNPTATPKEIRAAFIKLSKENHPDKNPDDPSLHTKFAQINEAYSVLKVRSQNKSQNRKTTGEQNYTESTRGDYWGDDDYHDLEHYAYMSSREYFHYTKQSMQEHETQVHRMSMSDQDAKQTYSYSGVIIALLATCSIGFFKYYLSKRKDDRSDERKQRDSAYFTALAQKIHDDRRKLRQARHNQRHTVFYFSGSNIQNEEADINVQSRPDKKNDDPQSNSTVNDVDLKVKPSLSTFITDSHSI